MRAPCFLAEDEQKGIDGLSMTLMSYHKGYRKVTVYDQISGAEGCFRARSPLWETDDGVI